MAYTSNRSPILKKKDTLKSNTTLSSVPFSDFWEHRSPTRAEERHKRFLLTMKMIILFLDKWQKAESEKVLKTIKAIQAARSKRKCSCSWACQRFCNIKEIKEKHQRHKTELRQCSTSYNYIWILHLSVLYHVNQTVPGLLLL